MVHFRGGVEKFGPRPTWFLARYSPDLIDLVFIDLAWDLLQNYNLLSCHLMLLFLCFLRCNWSKRIFIAVCFVVLKKKIQTFVILAYNSVQGLCMVVGNTVSVKTCPVLGHRGPVKFTDSAYFLTLVTTLDSQILFVLHNGQGLQRVCMTIVWKPNSRASGFCTFWFSDVRVSDIYCYWLMMVAWKPNYLMYEPF